MGRIPGIGPDEAAPAVRAKMTDEVARYGQVLEGTQIRARRPSLVEGWAAMNRAIDVSGLIPKGLRHLLYRWIALQVNCAY